MSALLGINAHDQSPKFDHDVCPVSHGNTAKTNNGVQDGTNGNINLCNAEIQ